LRASSVYPNPEYEPLINRATAADLEWLIARIDEHLAKKPSHLNDPDFSVQIKEAFLHYRTIAAQAQHTRKTVTDNARRWWSEARSWISLTVAIFALILSLIALFRLHQ